ncbi:hypothetical protein O6H91_07G089000 [Diphasiastrum complanatum]|nr:hypothetical protein O6H91_Y364300 [Diphasiastrum complanatum]KAJ7550223.1 hypothetical protein O6H91_07G089000 [Diphasiastrum complanatum]
MPAKKKPARLSRIMIANGDGSKKEEWTDAAVYCLLEIYGEKYASLRRGSLSSRDWDDLALYVNLRCKDLQSAKTSDQCKYKIENMKRRYRLEKSKKDANESVKIVWPYYARMHLILGTPVLKAGIPGGIDAGGFIPMMEQSAHEGMSMLESHGAEESQAESELPSPSILRTLKRPIALDSDQEDPLLTSAMAGGAKGSRTDPREGGSFKPNAFQNVNVNGRSHGKQQKTSASILGQDVASSIRGFAEVMLRIEHAKMELVKDLERQRAETELKRTEMLLNSQMQIVKLLSQRRHRSSEHSESD